LKLYLAGPMTGYADYNFPAFNEAAKVLRGCGHEVVNPAENFGGRRDLPWEEYLKHDVKLLVDCEGLVALPGWNASRGAVLEYNLAESLRIKTFHYGAFKAAIDHPLLDIARERLSLWEDSE